MRTVELTQDECDLLVNLIRQQSVGVAQPDAARVLAALQSALKKLTAEPKKEV